MKLREFFFGKTKPPKCVHEWGKWEEWLEIYQKRSCKLCGLMQSKYIL